MQRTLALATLLAALLAAPARASLTAAPFAPAPAGGDACLRATGFPDELVLAGRTGVALWAVTPAGPSPVAELPVDLSRCAEAASAPNGAAAIAAVSDTGRTTQLVVATRDPGGTFGPFVPVAHLPSFEAELAVAVNAAGDAVVAWRQVGVGVPSERIVTRVVRRTGGRFGAPQTLERTRTRHVTGGIALAAGIDATGTATVAFASGANPRPVTVTAPAGSQFGAASRVPGGRHTSDDLALAMAPNGRALLAAADGRRLVLAERAPGAGAFAPLEARRASAREPVVALDDAGGALVAWRQNDFEVRARWRAAPGPLGDEQTLDDGLVPSGDQFGVAEPEIQAVGSAGAVLFGSSPGPKLAAHLTQDGRAVVAWNGVGRRLFDPAVAAVASGDVVHGLAIQHFKLAVRDAESAAATSTPTGDPVLAWVDSQDPALPRGRVHVALPGAQPAPDGAPPRIAVRLPAHVRLLPGEPLHFTVRCSAACDLRASSGLAVALRSLGRAGTARFAFDRDLLGPLRARPVIKITGSAPGATRGITIRRVTRIRKRRPAPLPRPLDVHARRTAHGVMVTWRTQRPARDVEFFVALVRRAHGGAATALAFGTRPGRGKTHFRVLVRRDNAPHGVARSRYARVYVAAPGRGLRRAPIARIR